MRYKQYLTDRNFLFSSAFSFLLFLASIVTTWFTTAYATNHASNYVTDIVLSNTRVYELGDVFVYGTLTLIVCIGALLLYDLKRLPFTLYSLAIFFFTRAIFISLTHLGPYPEQTGDIGNIAAKFFLGADLFFSGHTGAPFMLALLFWHTKWLRYFFLAWSVGFAVVVLLAHLHYTIDVASAFFITYALFHFCEYMFPHSRRLFFEGLPARAQ